MYWDAGVPANGFVVLETGIATRTYLAINVTPGETYSFKVASRNIFDLGPQSNSVTILSAFKPERPVAPVTTIKNNTVVVTWIAPFANCSPLTSFLVSFKTAAGTFITELSSCDGLNSVIFNARKRKCTIPLDTLTTTPFSLVLGSSIEAQLLATNAYGNSPVSNIGSGAFIVLVPDAPKALTNNPSLTNAA